MDDEETLTSFDELERLESLPRSAPSGRDEGGGLGPREQSVESFDGSSLSGDGSPMHASGTSSTPMLRSVLTRKPSMAALKLMQEGGTGEGESEDEAEDDGVCSLSEFAMVLNAAAWVSALCDSRSHCFNPSFLFLVRMSRLKRASSARTDWIFFSFATQDTDASGSVGMEVIVAQLELLRGKVAPEATLHGMLGFDLEDHLSSLANNAGMVSVGAIGQLLYRGLSRSRSAQGLMGDRQKLEDALDGKAVKAMARVIGNGDDDAIITYEDLKAKLRYYGVQSNMTDIVSMMSQADIEGTGVVRVADLSRLLADELKQLRGMLSEKTGDVRSPSERMRLSLDMSRDDTGKKDLLLSAKAEFGVLRAFPTARKSRKQPGRLVWVEDEEICEVCLYDRSGKMMIEEEGKLVDLPAKLDYFTDVHRGKETRTVVKLPAPHVEEPEPPKGLFSSLFCCFSS